MYIGEWKDNLMHGYGEFYWPDGKKYYGYYNNDKKEGFGIFHWPNVAKSYIGCWLDGKQDGVGIMVHNGISRYGLWTAGARTKWLKGPWEISRYIGPLHKKYLTFLEKDSQEVLNYFIL